MSRRFQALRLMAGAAAGLALFLLAPSAARTNGPSRVWFTPNAGSADMLQLFTAPDEWAEARSRISVFKFYQGQVMDPAPASYYLPNDYANLRAVDAFRKVSRVWHMQLALEVGSVKDFYCTPDASGMRAAIGQTLRSIGNVVRAGGRVNLLSMDDPLGEGITSARCGAPDPGPTIDRIEQYMRIVRAVQPDIGIGLSEPYPSLSASQIENELTEMRARRITPAFFHLDADLNALEHDAKYRSYDYARDIRRLKELCDEQGVAFGFMFWGLNGQSDALYAQDVRHKLATVKGIFGAWANLPEDLVFQSFAESAGTKTVPLNLPETAPDTHTNLIDEGLIFLSGVSQTSSLSRR